MINEILPQDSNFVNSQNKLSTIIRVVHNRENPFVQLNKNALWDKNLSLKAIGLWARCLSRPDKWQFNIKELSENSKEGRRAIDSAMKELIQNDYVIRLEYFNKDPNGKFEKGGGVEYVFFEFPASIEEKQEQLELFKKSFRHCGFGNCRFSNSRNSTQVKKSSTQKDSKEKEITPYIPLDEDLTKRINDDVPNLQFRFRSDLLESTNAKPVVEKKVIPKRIKEKIEFSQEIIELTDSMIDSLMKANPDWLKPNNLYALRYAVYEMIVIQKRDPKRVLEVFTWAINDSNFWLDKISKPNPFKYLKEKFSELAPRMTAKPFEYQKKKERIKEEPIDPWLPPGFKGKKQ